MITFQKIRWRNFLSTGNSFTEIDLNKNKTTLIVGENGAGKSTILDALSFVLFGKPFRNINKPQLTNSINKKDTVCEIEFTVNKSSFKIVRGIKPVVFEVYQNGTLINQNAEQKDYQEILEKQILKTNHKSFCQVVVLGSASFVPFMQLTAANRRAIIEDILDLEIFTKMNALLKDKIQSNNQDILITEGEIKLLKEKIKMQKEYNESIIASNEKTLERKNTAIALLTNSISKSKEKISSLQSEIIERKKKAEALKKEQSRLEKFKDLQTQLNHKIKSCKETIDFFNTHDDCPTCRQAIDDAFKTIVKNQKTQQIEEVNTGIDKLNKSITDINIKLEQLSVLNDEIFNLNIELSQINTKNQSWLQQIKELEVEIKQIADASANLIIENINVNDLRDYETKYNDLIDDKDHLQAASIILKDGGIKSKIIKQYIPVINKLINKYLSQMDFFVNFELNEQFEETIKSRFRDEFTYASFSEGEKQKIDLALLFTWRAVAKMRNSLTSNLLIMDEIFDSSLDSNAADSLMNIIHQLASDSNVFIISHREQMNDKFTNIIRFSKHKNFSMIQ